MRFTPLLASFFAVATSCHQESAPAKNPASAVASVASASASASSKVPHPAPVVFEHLELTGTMNQSLAVDMSLDQRDGIVSGSYSYLKTGGLLQLEGSMTPTGALVLTERDAKKKVTGTFKGVLKDGRFEGQWNSPTGKVLPFTLTLAVGSDKLSERAELSIRSRRVPRVAPGQTLLPTEERYPLVTAQTDQASRAINTTILEAVAANEGESLEVVDFTIHHNRHGILDMTLVFETMGAYPSAHSHHFAFDLTTGAAYTPAELFTNTTQLAELLDAQLQHEIATVRKNLRDGEGCESVAPPDGLQFLPEHLEHFVLGNERVVFHFPYDYPHVMLACEPDGTFMLTYDELRPFIGAKSPLNRMLPSRSTP